MKVKRRRHIEVHAQKNEWKHKKKWRKKKLVQLATGNKGTHGINKFYLLFRVFFMLRIYWHLLRYVCDITYHPASCSFVVARIFRLRTNFTGKKVPAQIHTHTQHSRSIDQINLFMYLYIFLELWITTCENLIEMLDFLLSKRIPLHWKNEKPAEGWLQKRRHKKTIFT